MATVAEFTVPSSEFPLGTIFEEQPNVTVELDRMVPTNHAMIPYFWVRGVDVDDVESAFSDHPGVTTISLIDDVDGEYLLRVEWANGYRGVLSVLAANRIALISVVGTATEWTFEIRGDDRQDISELMTIFWDDGIPAELIALHDLHPVTFTEYDLTDAQREALRLAYERGYFESPRQVKMTVLADELGITRQAFADRLRRGLDNLLETVFVNGSGNPSS